VSGHVFDETFQVRKHSRLKGGYGNMLADRDEQDAKMTALLRQLIIELKTNLLYTYTEMLYHNHQYTNNYSLP
jgi:hypothetical protein